MRPFVGLFVLKNQRDRKQENSNIAHQNVTPAAFGEEGDDNLQHEERSRYREISQVEAGENSKSDDREDEAVNFHEENWISKH